MKPNNPYRSPLDSQLASNKALFVEVFQKLKSLSAPAWYPHLTAEKRVDHTFTVHPRAQHSKEDITLGVMLRLLAGVTLFERAVDDLNPETLFKLVDELAEEARQFAQSLTSSEPAVSYRPASWAERLKPTLEREILDQVPASPTRDQWVHFAPRQARPLWSSPAEGMAYAREIYEGLLDYGEHLPVTDPATHPDVVSVRMTLSEHHFLFIDEEVRMSQTLNRNAIFLSAVKGSDRGSMMRGGLGGQETVEIVPRDYGEVYRDLSKSLRAERLEPGQYRVLMAPSITGVFAHEAFGHTQEGDSWAKGRSKARELHQEGVAVGNQHATIVNNPAIYQNGEEPFASWGSYFFDEEGWLAERQEIVTCGRLNLPMTNLNAAVRLQVPRSANGKREKWTNAIYTRQTNTYFSEGDKTFEELIRMVDYGFLAAQCYGGMEDPKGMGIQVGIAFVEEIKEGRLTGRTFKGPNGGALQMTGYVPDYLNRIVAKSKIEAFSSEADQVPHPWNEVGGCGKYHKEYVVAGCGGPYMLVDDVHLG